MVSDEESFGQEAPFGAPFDSSPNTRVRLRTPQHMSEPQVLQEAEHEDHLDQSPGLQSGVQSPVLHTSCLVSGWQLLPAYNAGVFTWRLAERKPPPHGWLQELQADQGSATHGTGGQLRT